MNKLLVLLAVAACVSAVPSFNHLHYPGLVGGFGNQFYNYQPNAGYGGCRYWCRSSFTNQYYCCTTPQQAFTQGGGFNQGFGAGFNQGFGGGFNQGFGGFGGFGGYHG